jgi:hypothetical protein
LEADKDLPVFQMVAFIIKVEKKEARDNGELKKKGRTAVRPY